MPCMFNIGYRNVKATTVMHLAEKEQHKGEADTFFYFTFHCSLHYQKKVPHLCHAYVNSIKLLTWLLNRHGISSYPTFHFTLV